MSRPMCSDFTGSADAMPTPGLGRSCWRSRCPLAPRVGEAFTVLTGGQAAERLPAVVLLRGCVLP